MLTDDELRARAEKTIQIQAAAPKCMCACGCQYVLVSTRSKETATCFACRHRWHYGGTPLTTEDT
jgi:hypothetical protein